MDFNPATYDASKGPALPAPPTAHCNAGVVRVDVTPEVGIHNRNWGAAASDVATGIHMPLYVTAAAFTPAAEAASTTTGDPLLLLTVDLGWLFGKETDELLAEVSKGTGVPRERLMVQMSHTHAGPSINRPMVDPECPGGALALAWWVTLKAACVQAGRDALAAVEPVWIQAGAGACRMAQKRDLYDRGAQRYITAFDPTTVNDADDAVVALKISKVNDGSTMATVCNYGCHPTSLGHPSSLISPDYIGATRAVLEKLHGGVSVFVLGACGDTMPVQGHQGDPAVTDSDGRRVGYAAAEALEGLLATPGTKLGYSGPIVSGAVIGAWAPESLNDSDMAAAASFKSIVIDVVVPLRSNLPTLEEAEATLVSAEASLAEAEALAAAAAALSNATAIQPSSSSSSSSGDMAAKRALVEQARRAVMKMDGWVDDPAVKASKGKEGTMQVSIWQVGQLYIVGIPGEPYCVLQSEIRKRCKSEHIVVATMTNGYTREGYILPATLCGCGAYQDHIAVAGEGALELLINAITHQIVQWQYATH